MNKIILSLILTVAVVSACSSPQKFDANTAIKNANLLDTENRSMPSKTLIIFVSPKGEIFRQNQTQNELLGTVSEADKLEKKFSALLNDPEILKEIENKAVTVKMSREVEYEALTKTIDALKAAGALQIAAQLVEQN